jgi:hypothetical protein
MQSAPAFKIPFPPFFITALHLCQKKVPSCGGGGGGDDDNGFTVFLEQS